MIQDCIDTTTHGQSTNTLPATLCTDGDAATIHSAPIPRASRSVRRSLLLAVGALWLACMAVGGCGAAWADGDHSGDVTELVDAGPYIIEGITPKMIAEENVRIERRIEIEAMTLPELRAIGPVNPPNPANDGSYRDHRRTYCEIGLLKGVQCTNSIQVHHAAITDKALKLLGFPEMWKDPRNLVTACTLTGCPNCGENCHLMFLHSGDFRSTDKVLSRYLQYRLDLIEYILADEKNKEME